MAAVSDKILVQTFGENHNVVRATGDCYALSKITSFQQEFGSDSSLGLTYARKNWHDRRQAILDEGYSEQDFDQMAQKSSGLFGEYVLSDAEKANHFGVVEISCPGNDTDYFRRQERSASLNFEPETIYYRSAQVVIVDIELFDGDFCPLYFKAAVELAYVAIEHFKEAAIGQPFNEVVYLIGDKASLWSEYGKAKVMEECGFKLIESYWIPIENEANQEILQICQKMLRP